MFLLILLFQCQSCKLKLIITNFNCDRPELLKGKIRSEMTQQAKLSEKVLPSIAQIDIYQTYKL